MGVNSPVLRYTVPESCDNLDGTMHNSNCLTEYGHMNDIHGGGSGGSTNQLMSNQTGGSGGAMTKSSGGTLKRIFGNLSSFYTSRDKWTDQEKAIFYSLFFIIIAVILTAGAVNIFR